VNTFLYGGSVTDAFSGRGDPSSLLGVPFEQYRSRYLFLSPADYDINIADVVVPNGVIMR
jgi:hypothetical protein